SPLRQTPELCGASGSRNGRPGGGRRASPSASAVDPAPRRSRSARPTRRRRRRTVAALRWLRGRVGFPGAPPRLAASRDGGGPRRRRRPSCAARANGGSGATLALGRSYSRRFRGGLEYFANGLRVAPPVAGIGGELRAALRGQLVEFRPSIV